MCTELIKKGKRQEYDYFGPYDKNALILWIFSIHTFVIMLINYVTYYLIKKSAFFHIPIFSAPLAPRSRRPICLHLQVRLISSLVK